MQASCVVWRAVGHVQQASRSVQAPGLETWREVGVEEKMCVVEA